MFSFTELRSHTVRFFNHIWSQRTSTSFEANTFQYKGQMQIILALDGYKKKDRKLMLTNRLIVYLSWRIMKCLYTTGIRISFQILYSLLFYCIGLWKYHSFAKVKIAMSALFNKFRYAYISESKVQLSPNSEQAPTKA